MSEMMIDNPVDFLDATIESRRKKFDYYKVKGTIVSEYDDPTWRIKRNGKTTAIYKDIPEDVYDRYIHDIINLPYDRFITMCKCYVVDYLIGQLVEASIRAKTKMIASSLEKIGKHQTVELTKIDKADLIVFLQYLQLSEAKVKALTEIVKEKPYPKRDHREMATMVAYSIIEDRITEMFSESLTDEVFRKYFPVWFWVAVTFRWPMRPTEIVLTPRDCIIGDRLALRRTKLKGTGAKVVSYDLNDYTTYSHKCTETIIGMIRRYLELTPGNRPFLFEPKDFDLFLVEELNDLIRDYVHEYVEDDPKYSMVKYITPVDFKTITAYDSRTIALSNMYYQGVSADVCRQMAGHTDVMTTEGYFNNVKETLFASSIKSLLDRYNHENTDLDHVKKAQDKEKYRDIDLKVTCKLQKTPYDEDFIDYCIKRGHPDDCVGCEFYRATKSEIDKYIEREEQNLKKDIDRMTKIIKSSRIMKEQLNEAAVHLQTSSTRLKQGYDRKLEKEMEEWQGK